MDEKEEVYNAVAEKVLDEISMEIPEEKLEKFRQQIGTAVDAIVELLPTVLEKSVEEIEKRIDSSTEDLLSEAQRAN